MEALHRSVCEGFLSQELLAAIAKRFVHFFADLLSNQAASFLLSLSSLLVFAKFGITSYGQLAFKDHQEPPLLDLLHIEHCSCS